MLFPAECEGAGYLIATGAPNWMTLGPAKRIAPRAGKRIALMMRAGALGAGKRITSDQEPARWRGGPDQADTRANLTSMVVN
jgi:hypothetical protein